MPPRVSVIIPTFRRWTFLCDALESVFRQTCGAWEIVVVNDGGGAPEGKAIELLRNPKVTYIEHGTSWGPAAARNTGISRSAGEFIAYLDDDDVYYPDHLERLLDVLEGERRDFAYTDAVKATYDRTDGGDYRLLRSEPLDSVDFDLKRLWKGNFIPIPCAAHRRTCLENSGMFDSSLRLYEDWDLWLRISRKCELRHVPRVTVEYRFRTDRQNTTQSVREERWREAAVHIFRKHLADPSVWSDPVRTECLRWGISRFVRRKYDWFVHRWREAEDPGTYRAMFRALRAREKSNVLLRHPCAVCSLWLLDRGREDNTP